MKISALSIIILFGVLFASGANADMHDKGAATIEEVYVNSGGTMLIRVGGISGYLSLGTVGDKYAEIMYSTALAAKISNQSNLWIRYYDTEGYPSVGIISIK